MTQSGSQSFLSRLTSTTGPAIASLIQPTIGGILLLGPLSILALWGLKKKVLALEEKEKGGRKFWEAELSNPDPL